MKRALLLCLAMTMAMLPAAANAAVVSVNFTGSGSGYPLDPTDMAGNPSVPESFTSNWNNASGGYGLDVALYSSSNVLTTVRLGYSTDLGGWTLPDTTVGTNLAGGQNPKMMRGYLDAADNGALTLSGLAGYFRSYQIVIFFDGDNGGAWRVAQYTITDNATSTQLFQDGGEDSENVSFNIGTGNNANGLFQIPLPGGAGNKAWPNSPNNDEGNFLQTGILTADSITIKFVGTAGDIHRAPINGLQIIGQLANVEPVSVTIAATASASEPAQAGIFTVSRTGGSTAEALSVQYTVSGTAVAGTDYQPLSGSITIPAGQMQATIPVTPIDDGAVEVDETVIATLSPAGVYDIGNPGSATMALISNDTTAVVSVVATDDAAAEVAGNPGQFTITRTGSTLFPLTVNATITGSATSGADYSYIPATIVIPAGQASVTLPVTPFEDGTTEGLETVVLTLVPDEPQYATNAQSVATVSIEDNGSWSHWTQSLLLTFTGFSGSEPVADFPVLVTLNPGRVGNYAGFSANGADIRFRAGDVSLPYEIEQWNPAGTSYVWVRVPQISSITDSITMVWHNPSAIGASGPNAVWAGDYIGVWHLNSPGTDGRYLDSTLRGWNGTNFGGTPVTGWIGGALSFNASQLNYLDTGNTENLASFTVITWVRSPAAPGSSGTSGPVHREANYQLNWNHGDANFRARSPSTRPPAAWQASTLQPLEADTWYYLVGTYDGSKLSSYRNGALVAENTNAVGAPGERTNSLKFARHAADATQFFTGTVDEVQVLSAARSVSWVANQFTSTIDNFIAYGGYISQVTLTASDPVAVEPADNGAFLITRSGGNVNYPLTVRFVVGGTATSGKDYVPIPLTATFAAGQSQLTVPVTVIHDYLPAEPAETVVLSLAEWVDYDVSGVNSATVTITDVDQISDWQTVRKLSFGSYAGTTTLQDFPLPVLITPEEFGNYAGFGANGADIRFTDSTKTVLLPFEIEKWDPAGVSVVWVKVPAISSRHDYIWMYWNNPGAPDGQQPEGVWTSDYRAVYHFAAETGIKDSTANGHNGTDANTTPVDNVYTRGRGFNGANAFIDLGSSLMSDLAGFTMSGWVNATAFANRQSVFGQNDLFEFGFGSDGSIQAWNPSVALSAAFGQTGSWHYIAWVGSTTSSQLYVDGVAVASADVSLTTYGTSGYTAKIGAGVVDETGGWYSGALDEVRSAGTARSADWMAAEYLAMTNGLMTSPCGDPALDADDDGDVDQDDFGVLQRCFTGSGTVEISPSCRCVDATGDNFVTADDIVVFQRCATGPAVPADPNCVNAPN